MTKNKNLLAGLILFAFLFSTYSCSDSKNNQPEISKYIYGYTSGTITSEVPITIYLEKSPDKKFQTGEILPENILQIKPSVKGKLLLKDEKTVEFIPDERLKNGQEYQFKLYLGGLMEVPKDYRYFEFNIKVVPLQASFSPGNLTTGSNNDTLIYQAALFCSDYMEPEKVEQMVAARLNSTLLPIEWQHEKNTHQFTVKKIEKAEESNLLKLTFNKEVVNGDEFSIEIPGRNQFILLNILPNGTSRNSLRINMSQNVNPAQNLEGLISVNSVSNLRYKAEGSSIYLYFDNEKDLTELEVTLHEGIQSDLGLTTTTITRTVMLPADKPTVRFIGEGVISPADGKVLIPFSAVALKAIDLQIIKVFQQNMNFFLQTNSYNGSNDIMRTARPVFCKKIDLNNQGAPVNLNKWNDFTVNLSDLIELEKGVIYRVEIRFRKSYTTLGCADEGEDNADFHNQNWNGQESYYDDYYYSSDYRWEDRDDPCTVSYYTGSRFINKNIINTSLGLLAKRSADNKYFIAVNDIATAAPISGSTVVLYNYQNQPLDTVETDRDGFAYTQTSVPAFILQARKGSDKAWLKVDDANSLSLSNFDVSGQDVQSGLKGFIYGERGVWRPGDDIYLSFILEDQTKVLPAGHPVIAQLINPKGNIVQSKKNAINTIPIYCFRFKTEADAPTGYWKAVVSIGGARFSKTLRIETVKPNRLSINMLFPNEQIVGKGIPNSTVQVKTRWLNGATTPQRKAITEVRLLRTNYAFKNFTEYSFCNLSDDFEPYSATLFDGKTDEAGNFSFNLDKISLENAPGVLNATFSTRVFEEGSDFSIATYTTHYSPYTQYAGIRLQDSDNGWYPTRTPVKLSGVIVNPEGEKINKPAPVEIKVYAIGWRWWWDADNNSQGTYINRSYDRLVFNKTVSGTNGNFTADLSIPEYGRYYIQAKDEKSGHTTGLIAYFGSWVDQTGKEMATMLNINTDKKNYKAGEKVQVNIPSSQGSIAIISLENGTSFRDIRRIETTEGNTRFEFTTTADMCPNIYVSVSLIQPQKERNNDRPVRLYGVVNVPVEDAELQLKPIVKMQSELRPGKDFTVTVSEEGRQAMDYTLSVVDEGLLSLTSFRTPDPFPAFYAREALGVKTWDFYDFIFGAYGARLEKAFAVGGDEALKPAPDEKNNRFKPVVLFEGPCQLKKGETRTHTFRMPEYIGEVKAMIVAATKNGKYGSASTSALVKKPLMISAALPRTFTPGDIIEIPVTLFAMNDRIKEVKVQLTATSLINLTDGATRSVTFNGKGEKVVWFKIRIKEETGQATFTFTAQSGNEQATTEEQADIRVPNPRLTQIEARLLKSGETAALSGNLPGVNPTSTLEISTTPPLNIEGRLNELIGYPHGCAEQITSTVFPQISLGQLTPLTNQQKTSIEDNVKAVINRLRLYQTPEGGFAYWPGESYTSEWVSTYIAHFLVTASRKGYQIPGLLLDKDLKYLQSRANSFHINNYYEELEQSYRLYVLALAGQPDLAAMNRMKERDLKNPAAQWQLATAYALCSHPDIARNLVRNASKEVAPYRQSGYTFGSDIRDQAIILQAMTALGMQQEAYRMLEKISAALSSGEWMSTQTTAFALLSTTGYIEKFVGKQDGLNAEITVNGKATTVRTALTIYSQELPVKNEKSNVQLKNTGKNNLYVRMVNAYTPLQVVTERIMSGLMMSIQYYDATGKTVDIDHLKQSQDITAEITVKNTGISGTYQNLALTYLLPSGFEIINDRLTGNAGAFKEADYTDIRDDRYNVYFSLNQNQSKTFKFRFNAAFPGEYLCPAIRCSAMYDNNIQAVLPGGKIQINR